MVATPEEQIIACRFRIDRPSVLVVGGIADQPVTFARLQNDGFGHGRTLDVPPEEAFAFQVMLGHLASAQCWIDGRHIHVPPSEPGSTFLFDLTSNPITQLDSPFETLRFYITAATLEQLSYDSGQGAVRRLAAKSFGKVDTSMLGLARSVAAALDERAADLGLFAEYVALAFHAHVAQAYGRGQTASGPASPPRGLAPWQIRRASDMMLADLQERPSISAMAAECRISASHFARAFKQTTGVAPHQWLVQRRMDAAKQLLMNPRMRISEIALSCGFVDQSHFSSVFGRREGLSPGSWRRQRLR